MLVFHSLISVTFMALEFTVFEKPHFLDTQIKLFSLIEVETQTGNPII